MVTLSRIDLNLFVIFDAIYTERGITRASEVLCLSQPAISHALARLRETIGDPLFIRQATGVVPTPMAHELIGPVRRALGEIKRSLSQLSDFDPAASQREFKVGIRPIIEAAVIPALVTRIDDAAPGVKISAIHLNRADFKKELSAGSLDAVVDVMLPLADDIQHQFLAGGEMVVVAREDHPALDTTITLSSYLEQDHVLASSRRLGPGLEDVELARLGFQRRVKLRCQNYLTAFKVVSNSNLLLTMPEQLARATREGFGNRTVPFPIKVTSHNIFLYWHVSTENDRANAWLRAHILAAVQDVQKIRPLID